MHGRGLVRLALWVAGIVALVTLAPDLADGLGQIQADHFVERGKVKAQQGDWAEALAEYDRALAAAPRNPPAHRARAQAHRALGEHQAALDDLSQALEIDPKYEPAYLSRGRERIAL